MTDKELSIAVSQKIESLDVVHLNRNYLINRLTPEFKGLICKRRLRNAITEYITTRKEK